MWIIPSWAIGFAFLIVVTGAAQVVMYRLTGRTRFSRGKDVPEELPRVAQQLENVQRRLAELEERLDFTERLLTKERDPARLAPPVRAPEAGSGQEED